MRRVLIECERSNNATDLAKIGYTEMLSAIGDEVRAKYLNEITQDDLNWCDLLLSVRPFRPISAAIAKHIKEAGKNYIVFYDDDMLHLTDGVLNQRIKSAKTCLRYADAVIGCNPMLTKEYAQMSGGRLPVIVPSAVGEEIIYPVRKQDGIIRFVYAAGKDHAHLFQKYIKPIMNTFLERYGDRVDFTFVGVEPDLSGIKKKDLIRCVPAMPVDKYVEYMKENRFDVGLSPLTNTYFTNRKYFNKYIEYSRLGLLGLYSDCLPYTLVVSHEQNGFLVGESCEDWLTAMSKAVEERQLCNDCIAFAQKHLREQFSFQNAVNVLREGLAKLEERDRQQYRPIKIPFMTMRNRLFSLFDKGYKLIYRLKTGGIKETCKAIEAYIKINRASRV